MEIIAFLYHLAFDDIAYRTADRQDLLLRFKIA
jgi:hypothetical protein